jgi:hypothetical protein
VAVAVPSGLLAKEPAVAVLAVIAQMFLVT